MISTANSRLSYYRSLGGPWIFGALAVLAGLAFQLYLGIEVAGTAPARQMPSTWIWIVSPYLAMLLACILFRKYLRAVIVLTTGSFLCALLGYLILWMDEQSASTPGGMNPVGGGGSSLLSLWVAALFQWILVAIILIVTVLATTMGPRPQAADAER